MNHNDTNLHNLQIDSLWSLWETQRNGFHKGISEISNFDRSVSIFGGINHETISNSIVGQNASIKENSHPLMVSNNLQTISLSDMLKTNCCSRIQIAQSYDNIAAFDKNNLSLTTPTQWDGLQQVSNRKLQNKANSKRARQKKKQEWEQLKQLIEELKLENKHLKSRLGDNKDRGVKASRNGNQNKRLCKKCLNDMMDQQGYESWQDNVSSRKSSNSQIILDKQQDRVCLKDGIKVKYKSELQSNFQGNVSKQIDYGIQDKQLEMEFEQVDFDIKTKQEKMKSKSKGKEWKGKIWIAIGILMMVIGINIHGIHGSGEKSIRVNEYEMKRWTEDLYNPEVDGFTIKMKSKVDSSFIQSEKDSQAQLGQKNNWNYLGKQGKMPKRIKQQERNTDKSDSWSHKNVLDAISFEPDEVYNRRTSYEEEQQEDELFIDKDLLFSIQAEFDDIGRYI